MERTLLYVVAGAVILLLLIAVATLVLVLRRRSAAEPSNWASEKSALEVELAREKERASRVGALEADLSAARDARHAAEQETASLREARAQLEANLERAGKEIERSAQRIEEATRELTTLKSELASTKESLDQERRHAEEKLKVLLEAKEAMTKEFQVLANDVMAKHGESFSKQNKDQIEQLLTPMRDKLKEFQEGLQKAHEDSGKERATLAEHIRGLSEQSAKMTTETVNLTRALKGSAQMQGAWGEMILETLLEKSGLREGEEYIRQASHSTEDGGRVRTDVIVKLPGGQHVIIDSKVSTVAFEAYVNAEDEDQRAISLEAHLGSMRAHIKSLSAKEYHSNAGGHLDYVIMFVPIEGALAAALQKDPNLTSFAVQNNVAIATPTTLMIALRTIENVWKVERRNQNAEAIAERAGHLYGKFVGFVEDLQGLGRRLNQAQSSFSNAMGKLQTGPGNLIGQAEKLKELGAKTTKALPKGLILDEGISELSPSASEAPTQPARLVSAAETELPNDDV